MTEKLTLKKKKQLALSVIEKLRKKYPQPECALIYSSPWELLVATILSAQCTDIRVNLVTPGLFKKFKTMKSFAKAKQAEVEEAVKSTGFFRNKAKNIIACAAALIEKHGGEIPKDIEELIKLPGIGRKTANVLLGNAYGIASGVVVDTHVKRLSGRIGLTENTDPEKVETDLVKIVPKAEWIDFSHLLIWHGRDRCMARKPDCENCELGEICLKRI